MLLSTALNSEGAPLSWCSVKALAVPRRFSFYSTFAQTIIFTETHYKKLHIDNEGDDDDEEEEEEERKSLHIPFKLLGKVE